MGFYPPQPLPSQEELKTVFDYDQHTGVLTWRVVNPFARAVRSGDVAGCVGSRGYVAVILNNKRYLAHRLIFKLMTGKEPIDQIDHIDGDRSNNRWRNLREASSGQNRQNVGIQKNNKSGVKGVCWDASRSRWIAYIAAEGSGSIRIGRFKNKSDAIMARRAAEEAMHGQFARTA